MAGAARSRSRGARSTPARGRPPRVVRAALDEGGAGDSRRGRGPAAARVAGGAGSGRHRVAARWIRSNRVGCYVPGGRYPLPSSLLMTTIPARVAGVPEVVVCSPSVDPVVLAAAVEAGVDRVFRLGGAHAVAAMAYGTATVPRVSKIVGPGNRWVSAAKALVAADCPIDFYAGPTGIPPSVAERGRASWIAADRSRRPNTTPTRGRCSSPRVAGSRPGSRKKSPAAAGHRTGGHVAVGSRRHHRHAIDGRGRGARQPRRRAPGGGQRSPGPGDSSCGGGLHRRVDGAGRRRLCPRLQSHAADRWRRPGAWRPARRRLRQARLDAARHPGRAAVPRRHDYHAGSGRRARGARALDRGPRAAGSCVMSGRRTAARKARVR